MYYDFQDSGFDPEQQLGRVLMSRDVFDSFSSINYDPYLMMPVQSTQYLFPYGGSGDSLVTTAEYDYRVMQPYKVTDVNENISVFDFSPLGLLRATAVIGKGTEGDYKGGSGTFYEQYEPSVRMAYDFFAFKTAGDPVWVKTISREQHYADFPADDATIIKVEYSDGFGRLLQTRVQAEDVIFGPSTGSGTSKFGSSGLPANQNDPNAPAVGIERDPTDPLNVVVSGWKIYNNKGKVVVQYEPFFDKGFDFLLPGTDGQRIRMFYDPLARVVKTINPDNSQQWALYGIPTNLLIPPDLVTLSGVEALINTPWINFAYDANDLASLTNPTGSNVPASHNFTPKSSLTDALGRTLTTVEYFDNADYSNTIEMNYRYDIRGNLLLVKDPYNRNVFEHVYDLRAPEKDKPLPPLWTNHIDKGESTVLFDAPGKPIESNDAKGARALSAFDVISRPQYSWTKNATLESFRLRSFIEYGDSAGLTDPENENLKGKPYKSYDEAGMKLLPLYDFKGNALSKQQWIISSTELKTKVSVYSTYIVDWTGLPNILDSQRFISDMEYDALNRMTKLTLPEDVATNRKEIIPTYNRSGGLLQVSYDGNTYVENIVYDAKGQRLLIAFGNDVMTRYAYDPGTFRLLRQRSEKYSKSVVGNVITYNYSAGTLRQDDGFNYDLIGNIVKLLDRMKDCGIVTPDALDRNFAYDPIYRLTSASGRESNSQSGNSYLYEDAPAPSGLTDVRAYGRTYAYDKLGNVQSVIQSGTNGFTRNFVYNTGKNTLEEINTAAPALIEDYTYDDCGNQLTAGSTRHYKWNYADQLICYYNQAGISDPTIYTQYDYSGQDRVSKLVRTGTAMSPIYERIIYIDGIFEYVKLENGTIYEKNYVHILDDKSRIAEIRINIGTAFPGDIADDITYFIEDQIGSSVMRTDTSGTEIDREEYYPFGDSSLRTFTYKRYRYVGKERDNESGLYYYGARYYAAWTCRFISVDPLAGQFVWQSSYCHAANNPITKIDVDGLGPGDPPSKSGGKEGEQAKTTYMPLAKEASVQTLDWVWHKGGVNGTKAGWMSASDYESKVLKPVAKDYDAWVKSGYDGDKYGGLMTFLSNNRGSADFNWHGVLQGYNKYQKENPQYEGWKSWIPIWGSYQQSKLDFSVGKNGWGTFNAALAVTDIFLVKSILQAPFKAALKAGFSEGMTKYFGVGMSHEFGASVSRWKGLGLDMSGFKHHWAISQATMEKYPALKAIGNQTWNLTKFETQASHMRWAHGQAMPSLGLGKIPGAGLMHPFSSTPSWFKFGLMPSLGGRIGQSMGRD